MGNGFSDLSQIPREKNTIQTDFRLLREEKKCLKENKPPPKLYYSFLIYKQHTLMIIYDKKPENDDDLIVKIDLTFKKTKFFFLC